MNGSMIDVPTPDGVADCYLSMSDRPGTHPGVLFMIDAIGLRDRIKEMADRIAADGYTVLAPNVFYRAGRAPLWETPDLNDSEARGAFFATIGPLMGSLTAERVRADGAAYVAKLAELSPGPVGITGYCLGGRLGWIIAADQADRVAALGGFHTGRMVTEDADSPHLLAPQVKARVYWGHADEDESMSSEHIRTLDAAMDAAAITHTTELYAGAHHGYTMSDMGAYNEAASERHFRALADLLATTLPAAT
ncbi:dienelactone hydrolase family protein [Conexibacter sp. DBS9H8]|uniref:dienelactone hydrolase family protein n=1 Tax=Conexibacter sp. DBS9H8 TaxID=2937801 RepID=UPI00200F4F02|nr:dienelactone hydrolase family protein [Conexibacter sp. DBS9H8]